MCGSFVAKAQEMREISLSASPRQYLVPRTNIWQMENVSNVTNKIIFCS